jgi:hypothetical protein
MPENVAILVIHGIGQQAPYKISIKSLKACSAVFKQLGVIWSRTIKITLCL